MHEREVLKRIFQLCAVHIRIMYRENVLLALTLLLTILILTFIVHAVMLFQKMNTDRRLEEESKTHGHIAVEDNDSYLNTMALQQQLLDTGRMERENKYYREGQQDQSYIVDRNRVYDFSAGRTLNQHPPDYGFDDPPPGSIEFPFKFHGSSGHISLEIPDAQSNLFADLEYESLFIINLLKRIARKLKDDEPAMLGSVLESAPIKNTIWFMPHALEALAEKFGPNGGDNEPTRNASDGKPNEFERDENNEHNIYKEETDRG